jgi:zinc transport system substrate-binding protein
VNSKAYLLMGHLSFEATWKDKLMAANNTMSWFDLSKGINLIQGEHNHHHDHHDHVCTGGIDPHTWTSPKEMLIIAGNIKTALISTFPDHKVLIESNYELLIQDLNNLNERLQTLANEKPGLSFMIFHPAYTYLARAYGFEQMTIEFEGKTPTPARMKSTIELAKVKGIKTIYIQQEFDQANADVIAKAIGAHTTQVNPLSENWLKEMERFISHLEKS